MRVNGKTKRSATTLLVVTSLMMLTSCNGIMRGKPKHCTTKEEWPNYWEIVVQKREAHQVSDTTPTEFIEYAARVSYLEGVCKGINGYRNDDYSE
jgi:hypothetical protein